MNNCFEILGIEPVRDVKVIKRAYAAKTRTCHPEEHPEEFRRLHAAYQQALGWAKSPQEEPVPQEEEVLREEEILTPESKTQEERDLWDIDYKKITEASVKKEQLGQQIRFLMERCRVLYQDERKREKQFYWRDIFEEKALYPVFETREFVQAWYAFLESHHMFPLTVWQLFASLDGQRFSGEAQGLGRFPYERYIAEAAAFAEWKEKQKETAAAKAEIPPVREKGRKKSIPRWAKVIGYLLALAGSILVGTVMGSVAGLILG